MLSRRWFLQLVGAATGTVLVTKGAPATATTALSPSEPEAVEAEFVDDEEETSAPVLSHSRPTRLESFLRSRGIKPKHLAHDSGYSRAHLLKVRMGRIEPTLRCKVQVIASLRRLSRERVTMRDIFPDALLIFTSSTAGAPPRGRVSASRQRLLIAGRKGQRWSR